MEINTGVVKKGPRPVEILVVEDNVGDAYLLLKYLKTAKVANHTIVVRDGQDASDYLKKNGVHAEAKRPDLIFLDLNLPRKDGRILLREIKENPELAEIPVLVLTTSSWEQDVKEAYDFHANLYLVKSADLDQFLASMKYVEDIWLKSIVPSGR